jgi:hypothetical protein
MDSILFQKILFKIQFSPDEKNFSNIAHIVILPLSSIFQHIGKLSSGFFHPPNYAISQKKIDLKVKLEHTTSEINFNAFRLPLDYHVTSLLADVVTSSTCDPPYSRATTFSKNGNIALANFASFCFFLSFI